MKLSHLVMGMPEGQRVALYDYETGREILPPTDAGKLMTMKEYTSVWRTAFIHSIRAVEKNVFELGIIENEKNNGIAVERRITK